MRAPVPGSLFLVHAKVRLQKKPAGLSRQEIEREVNIVLHRYIPRVETIDIEVPE